MRSSGKSASSARDVLVEPVGDLAQRRGGLTVPQAVLQPVEAGEARVVHAAGQPGGAPVDRAVEVAERAVRRPEPFVGQVRGCPGGAGGAEVAAVHGRAQPAGRGGKAVEARRDVLRRTRARARTGRHWSRARCQRCLPGPVIRVGGPVTGSPPASSAQRKAYVPPPRASRSRRVTPGPRPSASAYTAPVFGSMRHHVRGGGAVVAQRERLGACVRMRPAGAAGGDGRLDGGGRPHAGRGTPVTRGGQQQRRADDQERRAHEAPVIGRRGTGTL